MKIDYGTGAISIVLLGGILTGELLLFGSVLGLSWGLIGQLVGYPSLVLAAIYAADYARRYAG